ncbi:tetratricopeptide repeat-containing sensor histidine kinase [Galbibacter pacificus]|uniref:histidine kinase n=1 Tax=Galbibacter pacificus TaxID=2996052 RepID=A0ABT6FTJ8_9FLAO|nr:sensor histidine kinase [Galbibacter pacificus]MDG3583108.1 sensor histidine kinase [Galbibacter pacificus]MDG3586589.1 sensor histidine kinase [Galbibacter pacificus]
MKILKYLIKLALICFAIPITAQENIAGFLKIADTTKSNSIKLQYLDSVVSKIDRDTYPDKFVEYSKEYIALAEEMKAYTELIDKSVQVFYYVNNIQNNKNQALAIINKAQEYEGQITDSSLIGSIYLKKGGAYYDVDFKRAKENYTTAISKFGIHDSVYIADSYLFRAQAESYQGEFLEAINDYKTAASYYEALGDYDYVIHAKSGIAVVYGMNKFYDKAQTIEDEVIAYAKKHNKGNAAVASLYNKASHYQELGDIKKQEETLLEAEKVNIEMNNNDLYCAIFIETSLTRMYVKENEYEKAYQHYEHIANKKKDFENEVQLVNHYKKARVSILESQKKYTEAIALLQEVIKYTEEGKNYDDLVVLKQQLSGLYEKAGNTNASYNAYKEYNFLEDSLFNVQKTNALTYYQTLYETEKKEKQIVEKNAAITSLEKDNQAKKRLFGFSIAGISLLFACVFLYRNRQHHKKSKEQQEDFSRRLLLSQEQERERISKDLHDGVGQSLLLIKNKVALNADENTKTMFNNAIEEVRSISRALHPFQLEKLGITKAIKNTVKDIDENTNIFITSDVDDISNILTQEQELHLYRIIQETLSNIVKHAGTEAAKVSVLKRPKSILVVIKDHGKGFDFAEKYNDFESLGLKTLRERTKFLKGTMKVDSEKDKGTTFSYVIPLV